jgi:hypothetical protein
VLQLEADEEVATVTAGPEAQAAAAEALQQAQDALAAVEKVNIQQAQDARAHEFACSHAPQRSTV